MAYKAVIMFNVRFDGEVNADLRRFTDKVSITIECTDPVSDPGAFVEFMKTRLRKMLLEWNDKAWMDSGTLVQHTWYNEE